MGKIGFKIWTSDLAIGEEGNSIVSNFIQKASEIIETEINEAGGIGGNPMLITSERVVKGEEGIKKILNSVHNTQDTLFIHGSPVDKSNQILVDDINLDSLIFFSGKDLKFHKNIFNTNSADRNVRSLTIKFLLEGINTDARVFFIHDGKRIADYEAEFTSNHKGEVKSINFFDFQKEPEIKNHLAPILAEIGNEDIIILDVGLRVFKDIFNHLNETEKKPSVIKLFGSIGGRFPKIGFPLIENTSAFPFQYLDFENLIQQTNISLDEQQKGWVKDAAWRLELPLLVAYAARQAGLMFSTKEQFLEDMRNALNSIDGENDIFIGKKQNFAFKDNANLQKMNYLVQFPQSLQTPLSYPKIFSPKQYLPEGEGIKEFPVNFVYIDILRVTNINIGEGTWGCDFYLDIVSPHEDPLEIINFNNLSSINPKFQVKPIWKENIEEEEESSSRFYIMANFDFVPLADNYPFDWQHIYISYSISDKNEFGIIQPTPEALLDREFKIDGWKLKESTTGVLKKKEVTYKGTMLVKKVEVREEARVGWTLARTNSVTIMKIGIPLSFLLFLNYFSLFRGFGDLGSSIGFLTTAFLSGIALYFSTERPQPLRMTTVDLIFLWYYVLTGVTIIITSVASLFSERIFLIAMMGLKFVLPIGFIGICIFLIRRIKSNRLKPRVN
jgi:hypothetical protein